MGRVFIAILFLFVSLASLASLSYGQPNGLTDGFYNATCPGVEKIVHDTVKTHFQKDNTIAPSLVRMLFHDCFVNGCDGSILIEGAASEKTAVPNRPLRGYEAIYAAKQTLENKCPGVVSCADILALAARDSVTLTTSPSFLWAKEWSMPTGRRDGTVSLASNTNNLPAPTDDIDTQIKKFNALGLSVQDLVTLVGAHTIGTSACQFFSYRLYNYSSSGHPDPSIDRAFLVTLQSFCPQNGDNSTRVPLDLGSEKVFDNTYFRKVSRNQSVLESDQRLYGDSRTKAVVDKYLQGLTGILGLTFKNEFPKSMLRMANIGVLTGSAGVIRKNCSATA